MAANGGDVGESIEELRNEIASLKQQDADTSGQPGADSVGTNAAIVPGIQGTPNPLQRNNE